MISKNYKIFSLFRTWRCSFKVIKGVKYRNYRKILEVLLSLKAPIGVLSKQTDFKRSGQSQFIRFNTNIMNNEETELCFVQGNFFFFNF